MYRIIVATALAVVLAAPSDTATAQTIGPASPHAASLPGPLPRQLTLDQALAEAQARSPTLAAARAEVSAAQGRVRQAGFRSNPEFTVELENFAGSGVLSGFHTTEVTAAVNQRLDFAGHRRARVSASEARLFAAQLRLAIARADLDRQVRNRFAEGVSARDLLAVAEDNLTRAQELVRVAKELVDAGREPPLRGLRARAALARTTAALRSAEADERNARSALAALLGSDVPPERLVGDVPVAIPATIDANATLDVALAKANAAIARADVAQARAEGRVDPSVGVGMRHLRETGDVGLVASVSMPLPVFDRNEGNIAAARSDVAAADARVRATTNEAAATIANARASLAAAEARLGALEQSGLIEAREALRLAELSYRAGKASLVELLDAQQAYALLQSDLIAARQARVEAIGDAVARGETIATIESRDAASISGALRAAQARAAQAKANYAREQRLYDAKVTARADLEAARADYQAAAAQVASASGEAAAAGVSGRFVSVRSPIAGRITAAPAVLGSYVSAADELFRIANPAVVQAEVSVPVRDGGRIKPGAAAVIEADGNEVSARVRSITPSADAESRTMTVVLTPTSGGSTLTPGEYVRARITASGGGAGVAVPSEAVQSVGGRDVVFVRTARGFAVRPVEVGERTSETAQILNGVKPGETVAGKQAFVLKAELEKGSGEED